MTLKLIKFLIPKCFLSIVLAYLSLGLTFEGFSQEQKTLKTLTTIPELDVPFIPQKYIAYKAEKPIEIDGDLTDEEWGMVDWTNKFEDLEGDNKPKPLYDTKVKMMWDDAYFYFAAGTDRTSYLGDFKRP